MKNIIRKYSDWDEYDDVDYSLEHQKISKNNKPNWK